MELDHEKDNFFVLGCDGVFELLTNQDVVDAVREGLEKQQVLAKGTNDGMNLDVVVEELLGQCISPNLLVTQGKGGDNVSAIVVLLPGKY